MTGRLPPSCANGVHRARCPRRVRCNILPLGEPGRRGESILKESRVSTTTVTLTADDVRAAVSMRDAIDAIRHAFLDLEAGAFEQPTRTALRDGQFLVMSAHHRETA